MLKMPPLPRRLKINNPETWNLEHKVSRRTLHASRFTLHEKGAALLATTLAVILILLAVGLSMISSGIFEGFMSHAQGDSQSAFSAAHTGIKDAQLRVARNKTFTSAGYFIPAACALNGTAICAKIIVEKDAASACSQTISAGQDCIISTGTIGTKTRKIEVILSVEPTNGKINQVSWKEL